MMKDDRDLIEKTLAEYYKAFSYLRPSKVIEYNHLPQIFIMKKVVVIKSRFIFWLVFKFAMMKLKKKGYVKSKLSLKSIRFVNKNVALVDGKVTRIKISGDVLEEFEFIYTMKRVNDCWKIVVGLYP